MEGPKDRIRRVGRAILDLPSSLCAIQQPLTALGTLPIRDRPGQLSRSDRDAVYRWIALNEAVLLDYWNNAIFTDEMLARVRPLSPPVLP